MSETMSIVMSGRILAYGYSVNEYRETTRDLEIWTERMGNIRLDLYDHELKQLCEATNLVLDHRVRITVELLP